MTGHGLATFAGASVSRLLLFQTVLATLLAVGLSWSAHRVVAPQIKSTVGMLPEEPAGISGGQLHWPDTVARLLAQSPQLALVVDPDSTGELGLNADIQIELGQRTLTLRGLLGQTLVDYPLALEIPLDRTGAAATWGAWRLPLLALLAGTGVALILSTWWVLAALYSFPAWTLAWAIRRRITMAATWRLCSAALLPAALVPGVGFLLYATLWLGLPGLIALWILHIPMGWAWIVWGIVSLPRATDQITSGPSNPFVEGGRPAKRPKNGPLKRPRDPFSR